MFVFMPFLLALGLLLLEKVLNKPVSSFGLYAGLLWVLVTGYFFYSFSLMDVNPVTMEWKYLSYSGFVVGITINSFNLFFSIVNSILLLLTIVSINSKKNITVEPMSIYMAFIATGFVNCAFMAKSLYTFFMASEIVFLFHYFCCCRVFSKDKIMLMRILNTTAAVILFLIILLAGSKEYDWSVYFGIFDSARISDKKVIALGAALCFAIRLFFFPFHRRSLKDDNSWDIVNELFVGNMVLGLLIYSFKKYVIDIFSTEFSGHVALAALIFAICSSVFCIFSLFAKNFLQKHFLIRKSLICLMLGAFLSFDNDVYMGIFTLLISHIFGMFALYVFFDGREAGSKKYSNQEIFLLAAVIYSLVYFPLSGGFVGFYKILLGYKSIHLYSLFFIFTGLFFLFITLMKDFLNFLKEGIAEKNLLHGNAIAVISICLMIIFLIGANPMLVEHFM